MCLSETRSDHKPKIAVFGFDVAEAAQIRRIRTLIQLDNDVNSFTMRRLNMNPDFTPEWKNNHLFFSENNQFGKRLLRIIGSIGKMAQHRAWLRECDIILARNLDMLVIAWAARALYGHRRTPLIYECLDINASLTATGFKARAMRWVERLLLDRVAVLAVSSPGFITNYFDQMQSYTGDWVLWENKIAFGTTPQPRPRKAPPPSRSIKIAWTGTIRCRATLELLDDAAYQMNGRLRVEVHGVLHNHIAAEFKKRVNENPYLSYCGPYAYPGDLNRVYDRCTLSWAQDLWRRGGNSDWLLPNRIYEASWCGCPSIAVTNTETGARVVANQLGWVIEKPTAHALTQLLDRLSADQIYARSVDLLNRPASEFVQSGREIKKTINSLIKTRDSKEAELAS